MGLGPRAAEPGHSDVELGRELERARRKGGKGGAALEGEVRRGRADRLRRRLSFMVYFVNDGSGGIARATVRLLPLLSRRRGTPSRTDRLEPFPLRGGIFRLDRMLASRERDFFRSCLIRYEPCRRSPLSFGDYRLSNASLTVLADMGISDPTPIQAAVLPLLLDGRDVIGQARTGSGKTLAFALPLIEVVDPKLKKVQALVLTPTRELASRWPALSRSWAPRAV